MSDAKQMTGATAWDRTLETKGGEFQTGWSNGPAGRTVKPAQGQAPKAAMIDGPFGGKKPA